MTTTIKIPKLGMSVTEGTVDTWVASDGATVAAGDTIYVLATDKTETEVQTPVAGVLRHLVEAGTTLPIGTKVATID
ncbi:lipoyl domain-containing protein [Sporichthya sp.]|uniref:lipoyl domain-containing protein n=1 Tax=Sporichthya sp. TaxID=65475 RepID=UPI0017DB3B4C|nr:lipoyl domain-containing protein [Sporichthya sp.]MBA3741973.1 dihydrolipoamide acyltransferase [Sporichthya sp.]